MNQTAPLNLPPKYQGKPKAYFWDKYLWQKEGEKQGWLEEVTINQPKQTTGRPIRFGDAYLEVWMNESGRPCQKVITRLEWLALGGKSE